MQTILHLSDLHFGWEGGSLSELAQRKVCLDGLLDQLQKLEPQWKPTFICVTGDIAWCGSKSDYEAANEWINLLLKSCDLTPDSLIICAGNHDIDRIKAKKLPRPEKSTEADEVLAPPIAEHFQEPFSEFIVFCKNIGVSILKFGQDYSYLVGKRCIGNLHFIVINSAWFSKDNKDQGKLWMGLPHLKLMEATDQLILNPSHEDQTTIALFHHPKEWFHADETRANSGRPNVYDYLANRCHLLLTGHTHGEVRGADRITDQALNFTGGSAFAGASHFNSFRLIQIKNDNVIDRSFEFDPHSAKQGWKSLPSQSRPISAICQPQATEGVKVESLSTADLREFCRADALKHLEMKSRLLRQTGLLPTIVPQQVSLRVSNQRDQFDSQGKIVRAKDTEQKLPLYEAVRQARRTMLLGDLGTGKSTLAAQLVIETLEHSVTALAFFIPVKSLRIAGQFTRRDLLDSIDAYVRDEICLVSKEFKLEEILNQRIEVLIVFDGLDELARDLAGRLLAKAATLVENWPTIQVISTARPVEMVGASYADWRLVHTVALDDAAKCEFLRQELIADGVGDEHLNEMATTLLRALKEVPTLNFIANSPLSIRLIYPRLDAFTSSTDLTLGDLLYEVLLERLDGWQKRDDKPSPYLHLKEVLTTAEAKAEYLAVLAEPAALGKPLQRDQAKALLQDAAPNIPGVNRHQLADEALSFFEWMGLVSISDTIDFPLQPLAEICAAAGLVARWHSDPKGMSNQDSAIWRVISFSATIVRRRGWMSELRDQLALFITALLSESKLLPAACYIVVESADIALAEKAVQMFAELEYRPLTSFQDERKISARNIAETLFLAGDNGFEWFYQEYLDPRYPAAYVGGAIVRDVFVEWASLVRTSLTPAQTNMLEKMVQPYIATGEGHFFGVLNTLSLLVPEAFSPEDRFWYQSFLIDRGPDADFVENHFRTLHDEGPFTDLLNRVVYKRCGDSLTASRLWLDWNKGVKPPYSIIRLALRSLPHVEVTIGAAVVVEQCRERLGEDRWIRFARRALTSEEPTVAAGAAKILYESGERRLSILGDTLLRAMHDGGYVAAAEKIIAELVKQEGDHGVRWLVRRIVESNEFHGAHSGWFRVLLDVVETIENGPVLLGACARNLGPFILPRRPEVRERFTRLLNGDRGVRFREVLRNNLNDLDPNIRRGAACILVTSDPKKEADALFVAVRSRTRHHNHDWHEWESFCLTLDFGPSVLASLKSKVELLEPLSRAFALALLKKGGIELEMAQREEFLASLSALGNWHLAYDSAGQTVLAESSSFDFLMGHLEHPASKLAQRAAGWLLKYHMEALTPFEEAKCIALSHDQTSVPWELPNTLVRLSREPDFANNLIAANKSICEQGGVDSHLGIFAKTISGDAGWKDVIWAFMCDNTRSGSSINDDTGMILLDFGLGAEKYRPLIGQAAKECLADPRMIQSRHHDTYHWLALLVDEFTGMDSEEIIEVILHGAPITYSATAALIARLGEVPDNFSCRRGQHRHPPVLEQSTQVVREPSVVIQQLREFGRDSDELHPETLKTIQESLFLAPFDEADLTSIATAGKPGILIATLYRFINGDKPKMSETIPLLDRLSSIWRDEQSKPHLKQLMKSWKLLREATIYEDNEPTQEYLGALDRALIEGGVWKLSIAYEILEIRGSLTDAQIPIVFADYAGHSTFLHEVLFSHLCLWVSGELTGNTRREVVAAAENAITKLDEAPWHPEHGEPSTPWANLLFPAIVWAFSDGNSVATKTVFLRGIKGAFEKIPSSNTKRTNITILLARLDALLAKVPSERLYSAICLGMESKEPSIVAFCRLIQAFGKHE